jgi:IrrE N-terminal-like domain
MRTRSEGIARFVNLVGGRTPEQAMRSACARLLRAAGIVKAPVPLKPLLRFLNVHVEVSSEDVGSDAHLLSRSGTLTIHISRASLEDRWQRARFTIAHEIGHIILYHYLRDADLIATLDESRSAHEQLEKLCNLAATELLMPRAMLQRAIHENGLRPSGLAALCDGFAVSRSALINSIANVLPGVSMFAWRKYARKPTEKAAYRVIRAPQYHPTSATPWLPEGCTAKHVWPPILEKAASERTSIFEKELSISVERRRWYGQGAVTFFPGSRASQRSLLNPELEVSGSMPQMMYLFFAGREKANLSRYFGVQ